MRAWLCKLGSMSLWRSPLVAPLPKSRRCRLQQARGLIFFPGHNYIYEDALHRMREIDSGALGRLTSCYIMYNIHHESVAARFWRHPADHDAPCLHFSLPDGRSPAHGQRHEGDNQRWLCLTGESRDADDADALNSSRCYRRRLQMMTTALILGASTSSCSARRLSTLLIQRFRRQQKAYGAFAHVPGIPIHRAQRGWFLRERVHSQGNSPTLDRNGCHHELEILEAAERSIRDGVHVHVSEVPSGRQSLF